MMRCMGLNCGTLLNTEVAQILAKNGLGNILGDFLTNSSGRPAFSPSWQQD
jgi:hypothetical protein